MYKKVSLLLLAQNSIFSKNCSCKKETIIGDNRENNNFFNNNDLNNKSNEEYQKLLKENCELEKEIKNLKDNYLSELKIYNNLFLKIEKFIEIRDIIKKKSDEFKKNPYVKDLKTEDFDISDIIKKNKKNNFIDESFKFIKEEKKGYKNIKDIDKIDILKNQKYFEILKKSIDNYNSMVDNCNNKLPKVKSHFNELLKKSELINDIEKKLAEKIKKFNENKEKIKNIEENNMQLL